MSLEVLRFVEAHLEETVEELRLLCRQPSVSAQRWGIEECARLVKELLEGAGLTAQLLPTPAEGYPLVYGELRGRSPRTVLFYNHYDVQPPDPLEEWTSPPFEPALRDGHLYARGVSDDKGHIIARLAAIRALKAVEGELPCSVKFCIEGAEEIGSPGFHQFVEEHQELLRADGCIWEGGGVNWQGQPLITLGLKGIQFVELECRTAARDAHSSYAPVVPNPSWRLVWALATLKDHQERVLIPGFYDDVQPPSAEELAAVEALPSEEEHLRTSLGLQDFLLGVKGADYRKRYLLEPACTICGLEAGYTGEGSKTIVPAWARAKLDFRLVPEQRPEDIVAKLKAHLAAHGFQDIVVRDLAGEPAARTPLSHPWVALVREAARDAYGLEPLLVPTMAGSGPMHSFTKTLGLPVASAGIDHPDSRLHAPNENVRLD
ncbi:MAG: M20/M25/M40 family metallo-hydrolase, partial [Dehalococcoidia bacterium]